MKITLKPAADNCIDIKYPCLAKFKTPCLIVLFFSNKVGMIIESDNDSFLPGNVLSNWEDISKWTILPTGTQVIFEQE